MFASLRLVRAPLTNIRATPLCNNLKVSRIPVRNVAFRAVPKSQQTKSTPFSSFGGNNKSKSKYALMLLGIPAAFVGVAMCETSPQATIPARTQVYTVKEPEIIIAEPPSQVIFQDRLGRLSLGFVLGFTGGYAAKQIGKVVLMAVGTFFMIVQYLAYRGYVTVNWTNVANKATPITDPVVRQRTVKTIIAILTHNLLLKTGFISGLLTGFKLG